MNKKQIVKNFTPGHFRDWLRSLANRNRPFNYSDIHNCMVCAYLKEQGVPEPSVGATVFTFGPGTENENIPNLVVKALDKVVCKQNAACTPRNVLKALGRNKNL